MSSVKQDRLLSIDVLRGLIMVVMALDHVSLMVGRFHSTEMWAGAWTQYASALPFLTRFVTHFCAPGFYFLMGVGVSLLADARRKQGWSDGRIARFLLVRGLLLILVSTFLEIPAWLTALLTEPAQTNVGQASAIPGMTQPLWVFTVLIGLAGSMILSAAFIRFRSVVWAILAAAALLGTALTTPGPADFATPYSFLRTLLMLSRWSHRIWVQYPIIPWFGTTALGVLFGRWIVHDRSAAFRSLRWIGAGALLLAIALRAYGGFGNIRPPRDGSWIEFLNFIKYPPALVFTLFMLGGDLLLLDVIERTHFGQHKLGRLLQVFGQAPLAYYLAHLWLFALIGAIWFRQGTGYLAVYLIWAAGMIPLYFITRAYRNFKMAKSADSLWRFF